MPLVTTQAFTFKWEPHSSPNIEYLDEKTVRRKKGGSVTEGIYILSFFILTNSVITLRSAASMVGASGIYRCSLRVNFGSDTSSNVFVGVANCVENYF
jgi:hypothetical protein